MFFLNAIAGLKPCATGFLDKNQPNGDQFTHGDLPGSTTVNLLWKSGKRILQSFVSVCAINRIEEFIQSNFVNTFVIIVGILESNLGHWEKGIPFQTIEMFKMPMIGIRLAIYLMLPTVLPETTECSPAYGTAQHLQG